MANQLIPIGECVWVVEGAAVPFLGLSLPTRMTVVRLQNGSLWLHSPVSLDSGLAREVNRLGPVEHLIAPNKYHHLFLTDWAEAYPAAAVHGAPGLIEKRPDIHFSAELGALPHLDWVGQIEQVIFSGSTSFDEILFFHPRSSTAILTDLIVNLRLNSQSMLGKIIAHLDGVAYPKGGVSNLYKLSLRHRAPAQAAIRQLLAWNPEQAVISHGEWFKCDAAKELRARFEWLVRA